MGQGHVVQSRMVFVGRRKREYVPRLEVVRFVVVLGVVGIALLPLFLCFGGIGILIIFRGIRTGNLVFSSVFSLSSAPPLLPTSSSLLLLLLLL